MKILFVVVEVFFLVKVGGMGDVVGFLFKVLYQLGYDVCVFMFYYGFIGDKIDVFKELVWKGEVMFQQFVVYQFYLLDIKIFFYLFGYLVFDF